MSLVLSSYGTSLDDPFYGALTSSYGFGGYGGYGSYGGGYGTYAGYNNNYGYGIGGGVVVPSNSGYQPRAQSQNPFRKPEQPYNGPIGFLNPRRALLRPENDRLDQLVQVALVKIDAGVQHLKALAEEADAVRRSMSASETGGSRELRGHLQMANREIYRLRTLLAQEGGAGDLNHMAFAEDASRGIAQQEGGEQEVPVDVHHHLHIHHHHNGVANGFAPQQDGRGAQFSFFGLIVAESIKIREDKGQKFESGAVKVVKVWGPASDAGIEAGDYITHINDEHVVTLEDFNRVVTSIGPNKAVSVIIERNGQALQTTVQTSNTDIAPGTINAQNIVHAQNATDSQRRYEGDNQTLHL